MTPDPTLAAALSAAARDGTVRLDDVFGPKAKALYLSIMEHDDYFGILIDVIEEARAPLLAERTALLAALEDAQATLLHIEGDAAHRRMGIRAALAPRTETPS